MPMGWRHLARRCAIGIMLVTSSIFGPLGCRDLDDAATACASNPSRCTPRDGALEDSFAEDGASDAPADVASDGASETSDAGPTAAQRAENTCARLTACSAGVGATDFGSCVRSRLEVEADVSGHPLRATAWNCFDSAATCSDGMCQSE